MRVTEDAGLLREGDAFVCPECTQPYDSACAAASCDCGED